MWHPEISRIDVQLHPLALSIDLRPHHFCADLRRLRPTAFPRVPRFRVRKLPAAFRLASPGRMDLRAPDVPLPAPLLRRRISAPALSELVGRPSGLDYRLSPFGPASFRGC